MPVSRPDPTLHVAMLGPDLDAQGGISSVARTWLGSPAMHGVRVDYVGTMRTAAHGSAAALSPARKAAVVAARQARFVARLARGWRPDLFHVHASYFVSFYRKMAYLRQIQLTGRPAIVHIHAPDLPAFHDSSRLHAVAMRHTLSRADRVIALSQHMAGELRGWFGDELRIEVLYNPVDLRRFAAPKRSDGPHPRVLFMGEIGERKGTWDLLAAIPEVLRRVPQARFSFGGNGDVPRLQAEARALGVDHAVEVLGWLSGDAMVAAYSEADVYCLPSYKEGLPMSILEAMGSGLPVVSTPIAGIPESVIHDQTGVLVTPGDRAELAHQLTRLLEDRPLRLRMGQAGRRLAEQRFDVDVLVRRLRTIWRDTLDDAPRTVDGGPRTAKSHSAPVSQDVPTEN